MKKQTSLPATMFLTPTEAEAITARVAELEASCGVEVVTLVVGKADVYPETVRKAIALGASIACLAKVRVAPSTRMVPVTSQRGAARIQTCSVPSPACGRGCREAAGEGAN